jgi:hypothetical protein
MAIYRATCRVFVFLCDLWPCPACDLHCGRGLGVGRWCEEGVWPGVPSAVRVVVGLVPRRLLVARSDSSYTQFLLPLSGLLPWEQTFLRSATHRPLLRKSSRRHKLFDRPGFAADFHTYLALYSDDHRPVRQRSAVLRCL